MVEETVVKESDAAAATTEAVIAEAAPPSEEKAAAPSAAEEAAVAGSESFKEEGNIVGDLDDPEKKALDELKQLIVAALANNEFTPPPSPPPPAAAVSPPKSEETPAKVEEFPPAEIAVEADLAKVEESDPTEPVNVPAAADPAPSPPPADEVTSVAEPPAALDQAPAAAEVVPAPAMVAEELIIWGVPLLGDERSDTVLLKFLRARDFKVKDTLTMIKNAVIWRKQFGIDVDEDLGVPLELEKVVFMHGQDKEGHPVCYNVFGEFQDKELYGKAFGDAEKTEKFLKWRIQFLEKGIRRYLDFIPGGVSTMVQVNDLKGVAGPGRRELRQATKQALALLQDNYPEFVAKQVFINVPWWYSAYNQMISSIFTPRSKSKFVFSTPSRSAETLLKYIAPEQVPVQYGGLSKDDNPDFTTADAVTEVIIKPTGKHTIAIPSTEASLLVWEFRVLGWDVSYGAEFVPSSEEGYTVIVTKTRKFIATDEPVVKESFKIGEPGKVVLNFENTTSKKKKLLYRFKVKKSSAELL